MKKIMMLLVAAGFLICIGCANQKEAAVNDANSTSSRITAKVGEDFTIKLPANLTTGYSWRMGEIKPPIVREKDYKYNQTANTQRLVGAGGEEVWTFKAVRTGKVVISLEYIRPWEVDVPPIKKADFTIIITK
jgi:inhibitor of cysteine peptidase